jgi:hypothetical protein
LPRNNKRLGRPAEFQNRARFMVLLEGDELSALQTAAEAAGISASRFARAAILTALRRVGRKRRQKKGN